MSSPAAPTQYTIRQVLSIPDYRKLWLAQFVSVFGDFVALYAVYSLVSFQMHGTARQVSFITVSFLLPFALVGPIAGVLVDRWDAKRTMIISDLTRAALSLLLVLAGSPYHIYAILIAISTFSSFFVPAQSVVTPLLVPREALLSASAAMQQTVQVVRMGSPLVAGAVVGAFGAHPCYYLDSASFLISAFLISTIVIQAAPPRPERHLDSTVSDLLSGIRFILGHPVISVVMLSIAGGTFAVSCFSALIAIYVRDILHGQTYLFGLLGSLIGAGTLLGGTVIGPLARRSNRKERFVVLGIFGAGVFIAGLSWFGTRAATMAGCVGIGFSVSFIVIPAAALIQSETPHEIRGRVSSSSVSLVTMSQGIAMLLAGDAGSRVGIVPVYYGAAVALLLVGIAALVILRKSHEIHSSAASRVHPVE